MQVLIPQLLTWLCGTEGQDNSSQKSIIPRVSKESLFLVWGQVCLYKYVYRHTYV